MLWANRIGKEVEDERKNKSWEDKVISNCSNLKNEKVREDDIEGKETRII